MSVPVKHVGGIRLIRDTKFYQTDGCSDETNFNEVSAAVPSSLSLCCDSPLSYIRSYPSIPEPSVRRIIRRRRNFSLRTRTWTRRATTRQHHPTTLAPGGRPP